MRMPRLRLRVWAVLAAAGMSALAFQARLSSQDQRNQTTVNGHPAAANEVIVKFARAQTVPERVQLEMQIGADTSVPLAPRLRRLHSKDYDTQTLVAFLRTQPDVAYAEPNYIIHVDAVPNDLFFPWMWGLRNTGQNINGVGVPGADIKATNAWNVSTGSRSNVVAVIDTGINYTHPDLAANVWSAPTAFSAIVGGIQVNCAQGTHGFNAITLTCDPRDDNGHGSHVSGTIGALGNNSIGVVGVNWTASIMGAKFLDSTGNGYLSDAINAIEFTIQTKNYFAAHGGGANVRILSNSWAGGPFVQSLLDEINAANAADMLFVAAAGNSGTNNDVFPTYPASFNAPNIIGVAATDNTDHLANFSNYGPTSVHLAAPGVNIVSTILGTQYALYSGTSMATPHVSGAAALILSSCALNTAALKSNILNNVDAIGALTGWVSTNGRLNVDKAIRACGQAGPPPAAPTALSASPGNAQVSLTWTGSVGATGYNVKRSTTSGGPYAPIANNVAATNYTDLNASNGTTYYYVVTAVNAAGESGPSNQASATPVAPPPAPTGLNASAGNAQVSLTWTGSAGAASYKVKRSTTSGGPYATVASNVAATNYNDLTVVNGTTYYYVATAVNAGGESAPSNQSSATPQGPPAAPTGLNASAGNAQVLLTWTGSAGATSYNVMRSTTSGGPYAPIANNVAATNYTDLTAVNGTTYFYVVTAVNAGGESAPSNQASATPVAPPPAPTGLNASAGNAQVSLTWTGSVGATGYNVKRSTTSGGPYAPIANNVAATNYNDVTVSNGTTYYYVVTAVNAGGESGTSNEASATPLAPPAAPTGLIAAAGNAQVSLTWTGSIGATGYNVKRSTTSGGPYAPIANNVAATNYTDLSTANGTTYYYVVTAVNAAGESGPSNQASATPAAPPPAPTGLLAVTSSNPGRIVLRWNAAAGATSYILKRSTTSGGPYATVMSGITSTGFLDTGLNSGVRYYYVVIAVNAAGQSPPSSEASAVPN